MAIIDGDDTNNSLTGTADDDILHGLRGDDTLNGANGDDKVYGDEGNDVLMGGQGMDLLDGGPGDDMMAGGIDDDSYIVDSPGDLVFESFEAPFKGVDTITSSVSYYLPVNVENLTLAPGAGDIYGVGTGDNNQLIGNEGNNLLIGGEGVDYINGGAGSDAIFGGSSFDFLYGGSGIDYIAAGDGPDQVYGDTGPDAIYGEDGDDMLSGDGGGGAPNDFQTDILVGGNGNDRLYGDSGLGDYDLLDGGPGNDTYYVDTPDDLTFEAVNEGIDTIVANIVGAGYYLYANVENLTLEGSTPYGVGNELANILTGSDAANWLLGGAGDDVLNGKGGNDVLFGEGGSDTFVFEHGTGGDVIGDFVAGTDKINLTAFGFASFAQVQAHMVENGGTTAIDLGAGDFIVLNGVPNSALHANDFILANASSGAPALTLDTVAALPAPSYEAYDAVHQFDGPILASHYDWGATADIFL